MSSAASRPDAAAATPPLVASVVPLVTAWRVDRAFDYAVPASLEARIAPGSLVRMPFGRRRIRGVVVALGRRLPERALQEVVGTVLDEPVAPPPLGDLLEWVALRYCAPRASAYRRAVPPRVRVEVGEIRERLQGDGGERMSAYAGGRELVAAIASRRPGSWCVRTVAGEDRGALVAELVAAAGRAGAAALVAVPEIRYGSEVLDSLRRRWPDMARVDSALSPAERSEGWRRLAAGHALGGGGRAAVLAPARRLGLVVLDEEHHPSLKEGRAPRYDARRVAIERARLQGAVCALVSPTPSVETGAAAASGRMGGVEPARAAARAARPVVELVDAPRDRVLSGALHRRVASVVHDGGRAALLVPRRGFARVVWCSSCRRSLRCRRCEAAVGYERVAAGGSAGMRCPRCHAVAPPPEGCPTCGAVAWRYIGGGSARVFEQVSKAWPRARVARADPDALAGDAGSADLPDIYVTTWIGTKEVLRPPVSLVGVLDADALIRRPDFRAAEGAYQALAEMAEWAGPAARGGRLVIQCAEPAHHAIQAVARADYGFFLRRELEQRAELGYPPFSELIALAATGTARREAIARAAGACRAAGARVLGPVAAPRAEQRALVKCDDAAAVAAELRGILAEVPSGTSLRVDVDPR